MTQQTLEQRVQRLEDIHEIHNLFGMHEYYHAAGLNGREFDELFAAAADLTFEPEDLGRFVGPTAIRRGYVDDAPPNDPGLLTEHAATTAVIEVADDGLTAQAVWISPGHETVPLPTGELLAQWAWGRYGLDLVKQDGEWKILRFNIYTTFRTPFDTSWVDNAGRRPPFMDDPEFAAADREAPDGPSTFNQPYHPDKPPAYQPVPPEHRPTFDESVTYTWPSARDDQHTNSSVSVGNDT